MPSGNLGQKRGNQIFSGTEEEIRNHQQHDSKHKVSWPDQTECSGRQYATGSANDQQSLFGRVNIRVRAEKRRRHDN